jgi:phage tail sheath protein FI
VGYKHGIYGELVASTETITNSKNVPIYIGTAPVHRVKDAIINKPQLIRSLQEAEIKLGYKEDDDYSKFTLSAAIYAHFQNKIKAIGPIVIINVLDPSKHGVNDNENVQIINKVGIIEDHIYRDSISITDKVEGTDYKLEYTNEGYLKITDISENGLGDSIAVTFKKIDPSKVVDTDIVGAYNEEKDERTGVKAISDVYEELNLIPSIISAPGFNQYKKVEQALVATTSKISDKWEAICFTDLECSSSTNTIEKAIEWKKANAYNSNSEKVCWPKGIIAGKEVWLSICAIVAKLQIDIQNDNIPCETPSNKQIDISGLIVNGNKIKISQSRANDLNEKGITTAIYSGGKYVLWGPHMANYEYGVTDKPEDVFDVNIMTNKYLLNDFQSRNGDLIDQSMTRSEIDALINSEQMILDSLVSSGKILFGKINFNSENNSTSDVINGDFSFDTMVTNTPLAKSITNRVQYTSQGVENLYGGEKE